MIFAKHLGRSCVFGLRSWSRMASDLAKIRQKPFVVICGCTGTGKTKLSIQMAQWLIQSGRQSEIINADAMQLYKNLNIITNKATDEEMCGIKHHLIGYLDSIEKSYTVIDYRNKAVELIDKLLSEDKVPILVGGTNYYIQSVLWDILIEGSKPGDVSENVEDTEASQSKRARLDDETIHPKIAEMVQLCRQSDNHELKDLNKKLENCDMTNQELYEQLRRVDAEMAVKLHPNDRRKICRSLQVFLCHGVNKTELLKSKTSGPASEDTNWFGELRYKNACIFVMNCETEKLNKRLDDRVDLMVSNGLVKELIAFQSEFEQQLPNETFKAYSKDFQTGIFQSIGFKEFDDYLSFVKSENRQDKSTETKLLSKGLEQMKITTRRYAKIQLKWIKNRFVKKISKETPPIFELDTTDLDNWTPNIYDQAVNIFDEKYLKRHELNPESTCLGLESKLVFLKPGEDEKSQKHEYESNTCSICNKVFTTKAQWKDHIGGKSHKKRVENLKRKEENLRLKELKESQESVKA